MNLRHHIPNSVTLLNLLSGCLAVLYAVNDDVVMAALFMFLGIFLDFFDGLLARLLNAQSALGVQLDSLADMVTSGLVPGLVLYKLMAHALDVSGLLGWQGDAVVTPLACVGFLVALATAYRLAKFNIDDDQQTYFKGLPSPANAILVVSLPLVQTFQSLAWFDALVSNYWVLLAFAVLCSYLLVMPLPLLSLKFKSGGFKTNWSKYVLLFVSAVLLLLWQFAAVPLIIVCYVVLSVLTRSQILSKS